MVVQVTYYSRALSWGKVSLRFPPLPQAVSLREELPGLEEPPFPHLRKSCIRARRHLRHRQWDSSRLEMWNRVGPQRGSDPAFLLQRRENCPLFIELFLNIYYVISTISVLSGRRTGSDEGRAQAVAGSTVLPLTSGPGAPLCPYDSTARDVVVMAPPPRLLARSCSGGHGASLLQLAVLCADWHRTRYP